MKETIAKINKTKSWFLEKINIIDKHLSRLIQKKREKNQINKIRNEKREITTDNAEIQRIIRDYYEQLYDNKMDNLEEMGRFLEKFNLPRLNQEEIEIMNNPITSTETEAVEMLLLTHEKTLGFLASGGEEFNPGPETRLECSDLLCNKVLLKYKGDRESF